MPLIMTQILNQPIGQNRTVTKQLIVYCTACTVNNIQSEQTVNKRYFTAT